MHLFRGGQNFAIFVIEFQTLKTCRGIVSLLEAIKNIFTFVITCTATQNVH